MKGAIEVVGELKLVELTFDTIEILGVHFPHNKKTLINVQKVLRLWNSRNLSLEGRILIF